MPLEPFEGSIEYIAVQYIAMGNANFTFKNENIEGVHICIVDSPYN